MASQKPSSTQEIVPARSQALTVRSASLAARGLRDLARDSHWLIKKMTTRSRLSSPANNRSEGSLELASISPAGLLCAYSPFVREAERIALHDIELNTPNMTLSVPGQLSAAEARPAAAFAWSSSGSHLVAAWNGCGNRLHVFDLRSKNSCGAFGEFAEFPRCLAWSGSGRYFASACGGGDQARVRLWESAQDSQSSIAFADPPLSQAGGARSFEEWFGARQAGAESSDEGALAGFGRIAFSHDETALASVVEMEGEWADDTIVVLDVPTLRRLRVFPAQGRVTGLAWTFDSRNLVYCSGGQAYRISSDSPVREPLPFGAEIVACHPHLPLCLCFSSWLKNSAKGRLFAADLNSLSTEDEYAAEDVVDLCWSLDGSKAYAVTADGLAYIYEPPQL